MDKPWYMKKWVLILGAFLCLGVIGMIISDDENESEPVMQAYVTPALSDNEITPMPIPIEISEPDANESDEQAPLALYDLTGTWLFVGMTYYVFNEDGSGTMMGLPIIWEANAGLLSICNTPGMCRTIAHCNAPLEWYYTVSDNRLTLISRLLPDVVYTYTRSTQAQVQSNPQEGENVGADSINGTGGVTAESYARLKNGMSIDEVQEIIGVAPLSETTTELFGITSTTIMWMGSGFSTITVMFTNGRATLISQIGL